VHYSTAMVSISASRPLKTTPESRAAHDALMQMMRAHKINEKALSIACGAGDYKGWLQANKKLKFGSENTLTHNTLTGALRTLETQGKTGHFFEFFCDKNEPIRDYLGISADDTPWNNCIAALGTAIDTQKAAKKSHSR
jgi:hypothetical protein